jgi:uncharacterized protein YyaL (SSP411 family)
VEYLRESVRAAPAAGPGVAEMRLVIEQLHATFDRRWGGFGRAPKFPPATSLLLLLRLGRRLGDERGLQMARGTLDGMARGGMRDHVGGGFHRYAVDERWLVPHFEKMLYDNALLARAYVEGYQAAGDISYRAVASETLDWVLREMTAPEGGFLAATDADSEGVEGRFFVWTPAEVREALGADEARLICEYYDITDAGNWEGHSIPNTPQPLEAVAERLGLEPGVLARRLEAARARLYEARRRRVPPGLDDKILTAWNGLMIGALAEGARVLREARFLDAATRAAEFVLGALQTPDGRLSRSWRRGRARLAAYLEDYACLADGLLDLYEAGGPARYLAEAQRLVERIRSDFTAPEGGFFSTAADHEALVVRHREGHDGATPSANAVAARALARLSYHLDRADYRDEALRAVRAYGAAIAQHPQAFPASLLVAEFLLDGPVELAIVGARQDARTEALWAEMGRHYLPNRIVAHHDPAEGESLLPLLRGKGTVDGAPALYVCRNYACRRPVTDPRDLAAALG